MKISPIYTFVVAVLLLNAAMPACQLEDSCLPGTSRCQGPRVQVCNNDDAWIDAVHCTDVSTALREPYTCQEFGRGGHTCLPQRPVATPSTSAGPAAVAEMESAQ